MISFLTTLANSKRFRNFFVKKMEPKNADLVMSNEQIEIIEQKLASNPYDYQSYFHFISILKTNEQPFDKIRHTRIQLQTNFPLQESVWLEWIIEEEQYLEQYQSLDATQQMVQIYEWAVEDCPCGLYLPYCCTFFCNIHFSSSTQNLGIEFEFYDP